MSAPVWTLADLRFAYTGLPASKFKEMATEYACQLLEAPERFFVGERWEVRRGRETGLKGPWSTHHEDPERARSEARCWRKKYADVVVVHITVYRLVKK